MNVNYEQFYMVMHRVKLYVNDEVVDEQALPRGTEAIAVTKMYLGGMLGSHEGVETGTGLEGCLSNIIINGK